MSDVVRFRTTRGVTYTLNGTTHLWRRFFNPGSPEPGFPAEQHQGRFRDYAVRLGEPAVLIVPASLLDDAAPPARYVTDAPVDSIVYADGQVVFAAHDWAATDSRGEEMECVNCGLFWSVYGETPAPTGICTVPPDWT